MALFMALAACYGVLQLAVIGWAGGRAVRLGTLLLAVATGLYACGVVSILLQVAYTRSVAAITGQPAFSVVQTAGYTVDPFIEEVVKVAPLVLLGLHLRTRTQWGLTDYLLLGSAFGAGFGLLEALLRFSHRADAAIGVTGGWMVPSGLSATFVPGVGTTIGSWLPAPATSAVLSFAFSPETYLHLAWSAVGGLGVGIILRGKGPARALGLLPLLFVGAEHAALNYDLSLTGHSAFGDTLTAPLLQLHRLLWLYPLVALGVAAFFDRRDLGRAKAASPDLFPPGLAEFSMLRPPWTPLIALRYVRVRRSLAYAAARAPAGSVAAWQEQVRAAQRQIARASTADAWRRVPGLGQLRRRIRLRLKPLPLVIWAVLLIPSLVYLVLGGFPATASLQRLLTSRGASFVLIGFLAAALAWGAWQLVIVLRGLPAALRQQYADIAARGRLRLLGGAGGLVAGVYTLLAALSGTGLRQRPISMLHVLAALLGAVLAVLLVLAIVALFTMFPPGGMALALATGGELAAGITLSAEAWTAIAATGALSGWMLAEAADTGGGGGGGGESGGGEPPARGSRDWRLDPDNVDAHVRELGSDRATGQFNIREAETGVRIEQAEGRTLARSEEPWADFVDPETGTTYDAVGNFEGQYFDQQWPRLQQAIREHAAYADRVPVDVSRFSPNQVQQVADFIEQNGLGPKVYMVGE